MAIYSIIPCCEEWPKTTEVVSRDSMSAQVTLRCPWYLRWYLMQDLIGNRRPWPWNPSIRAVTATASPAPTAYAQTGQASAYIDALVNVSYETPGDEEEDLVAESLEPTVEFLTQDYRRFRWGAEDGDPLTEGEAPGRLTASLTLSRTLYKVQPPLPWTLFTEIGKVNGTQYQSKLLGFTFAEGTLLMQAPRLDRTIVLADTGFVDVKGWDINLKFTYKSDGWNKYWRSKTQEYESIYVINDGVGEEYTQYEDGSFGSFLF